MTKSVKVLVVDDEPVILESAKKILGFFGLDVLTAADGEAGLKTLSTEAPDIVITDLVLPGISGINLLETALDHDPGVVVILTTGYSTVENAVAALKRGAFDFLPKPFTCDELLSCAMRARRAVEARLVLRAHRPDPKRRGDFRLGLQTWARPEPDGTALLGVTELELETIDTLEAIDLQDIGSELRQGGRLAGLTTREAITHNLWSPLGGRVLAHNEALKNEPETLRHNPQAWIVRIRPADLDAELANLIEA